MATNPFACGECHLVLNDGVDQCPRHPSAKVSSDWTGYVIIIQPERSEIAERLQVDQPGKYALKVNIR
ncbi:MAG: transcription elongation factor subunit Spt4 [Candidatus Thermoplasmatota archaeon]|jgi:DNA-directed RNA polymerase subunit E"|nr:transcription elongation factor subunit Spt4 [Candidatus Thermoplasmatota archaeon]